MSTIQGRGLTYSFSVQPEEIQRALLAILAVMHVRTGVDVGTHSADTYPPERSVAVVAAAMGSIRRVLIEAHETQQRQHATVIDAVSL